MGREEEGEVGKVQGKPPPKKIFCPRTARASSSIAMHSHVTRLYTMQQLYTPVAAGRTHDFLSVQRHYSDIPAHVYYLDLKPGSCRSIWHSSHRPTRRDKTVESGPVGSGRAV